MRQLAKPAAFQAREMLQHPALLLGMVLLGGWAGAVLPQGQSLFAACAALYLLLIQMAALPFVILAVYFGLQRVPAIAHARRLLATVAGLSLLGMLLCAVVGILAAGAGGAGSHMTAQQAAAFGRLTLRAEGGMSMARYGADAAAALPWDIGALVPDNLFGVLSHGSMPSILIGVLCFGAAVAAQAPGSTRSLGAILEASYRALESLVHYVNYYLPVTAFMLAATATAAAGVEAIVLLGGFLATFLAGVLAVSALALGLIGWRLQTSPLKVLAALREPIAVCLFSPLAVAAVPGLIAGMSERLGYSRGLVELCGPIAPVFMRAGEAMFFAVLAIFVANLYGAPLDAVVVARIGALSFAAALLSVGVTGARSVALGGFVLAPLGLPLEAVLPVFMLVEVLCEGARNLLSLLISSALIALVAEGLYINRAQDFPQTPLEPIRFVFSRRQLAALSVLMCIALASIFCAGVGFGLHKAI
ncbi:dicarboxylate/amino acid:cation symporter [Massilia forsythiae]|uniref:Dicarboxylate/amino acid:cation symporter n=1 Tax=Massilia forsythiae TaxID=2728020 RepID=A0A7Z2ZTN9_9BURK|nr:cation:dicarboxylase symporter family transporter [Massilia forsythiae]QJE01569.1 dicarboxylate/amino acid:cation symporter [Massilia forsythiae]